MANIRICPSKIPEIETRILCATLVDAVERYFADPKHQQEFEEWKREQEEKKACLKLN